MVNIHLTVNFIIVVCHFYAPAILMGLGGGHTASPLTVCLYVTYVCTKTGFRAISFETIGILDYYFIHRYMIRKYRSSLIKDEISRLLTELWPMILYKKWYRAISFEYIGILDSYFIHRYIIIKYRSTTIKEKIHCLLSELWPLIS